MQPFCAKAESESRFQRWRFFWVIWFPGRCPRLTVKCAFGATQSWRKAQQSRALRRAGSGNAPRSTSNTQRPT